MKYDQIIQKLLKQQTRLNRDDHYFLSVYLPNKDYDKERMRLETKSALLSLLHEYKATQQALHIESRLIEPVQSKIQDLTDLKHGVAIFAALKLKRDKLLQVVGKLRTIPLAKQPIKEIQISSTYDLDQLLAVANAKLDALVVNLHQKEFEVYELTGGSLNKTFVSENWYLREKPKHYLEKFGPTGKKNGIYHGTGSNKLERTFQKETQTFMNWLKEYLLEKRQQDYQQLIIFYTSNFQEIINGLRQALEDRLGAEQINLINKTLVRAQDIRDEVLQIWEDRYQQQKEKQVEEIAEEFHQLKTGWNQVTQASRLGQIQTLYIKPDLNRKGYVLEENMLYSYPAKGTTQVNNLAPWLVTAVKQQDGEVVVLQGEEFDHYPDVMAAIRFET